MKNSHYSIDKIELITVVSRCKLHNFIENSIKYIVRYDRKGTPHEDLSKALAK